MEGTVRIILTSCVMEKAAVFLRGCLFSILALAASGCITRYVDYGGTLPPLTVQGQMTYADGGAAAGKEMLLLAPHFMGWRDAAQDLVTEKIEANTKRYESARVTTDADGKFEYTFPEIFRLVGGKETLFPFHHYSGSARDEWNRIQVLVALAEKPGDFVLIRHFKEQTSVYYLKSDGKGQFEERPTSERSLGVNVSVVRESGKDSMETHLELFTNH